MNIKSFVFQSLVGTVAAPAILAGHAMIGAGTVITSGGFVTKEFGEQQAVKWAGRALTAKQQAIEDKQAAEAKKDAAKLRRHQLRVERLEAELQRELGAFRASSMELEMEMA